MKEFNFSIYNQSHKVVITNDFLKKLIAILFIVSSATLLGIFELFKMDWDWSLLSDTDFWINYFIKLALFYLSFFGAYLYRKCVNLKSPKILEPREILRTNKSLIFDNFKTSDCEQWIENVYNYEHKLEIYKIKLQQQNSRLNVIEPEKPKDGESKIKFKIYQRELKRFNKNKQKRAEIEFQLKLVEKHKHVIEFYRLRKNKEAQELYKTFEQDDKFKFFHPKYKPLTFEKLFNVNLDYKGSNSDDFDYNEVKVVSNTIIKTIGIGAIFTAISSSIILEIQDFNIISLVYIAINLLLILWYIFSGIRMADKFVFGVVCTADADRIKVCNKYRDDCILIGNDWAKNNKSSNSINLLQKSVDIKETSKEKEQFN